MKAILNSITRKSLAKGVAVSLLIAALFSLSACDLDQKGMVMMVDPEYRASIIGTNKSGFTVPDGILWKDGKIFMADEGGDAIRVWSAPGVVRNLCDSSLGIISPEDLVMDREGNIFFTDDDAGGLWTVSADGKASLLAGKDKGLISTEGIALAPSGNLLVGDGEKHEVFCVTRSGEVSTFLGPGYGITKPESMVFDEKGNLYIADNQDNVLYLLTPEMKFHKLIERREGFSPETIWYANGVLYITDSQNGKLSRYTPEDGLKTIAVFGGKLANICGVTTDDQGNIYVSIQTNIKKHLGYLIRLDKELQP